MLLSPPPRIHAPTSAISWFSSLLLARTLAPPADAMARRRAGRSAASTQAGPPALLTWRGVDDAKS
jgi:hypothetical protein